ncbi:MAG: MBL fold metallo-hydrolase [Holophagaceae bacterium]|nr:MBL fold metallo-hydrolase [Holophagaceae bacterium]
MQYASLASGSKGNCHALNDGKKILLVDAGVSFLQIKKRFQTINWYIESVQGVAITHEHGDHTKAIAMILKHTDWDILATADTLLAIEKTGLEIPISRWKEIKAGNKLAWKGWQIYPFSISHDAVDPVAYRIEFGDISTAIITDLGYATTLVADYCKELDFLVLESNHDVEMLREGTYDPSLKKRILSRDGHLSNDQCAGLLKKIITPKLKNVVLAHLSQQNNDPALARLASTEVISQTGINTAIYVATQDKEMVIEL